MRNVRTKGDAFIVVTSDDAKLFNPNRIGSSAHEALQRGKACLGCRRRKMRCDGLRPICTQCITHNRVEDCEYTDAASGPTRTQILEETLARLQARVKELERPASYNITAPMFPLSDPYSPASSSGSSFGSSTPEAEQKPKMDVLACLKAEHPSGYAPTPAPSLPETPDEEWWEFDEPPPQIANMLIRIFLPNSHQLGFALNVTRFLNAVAEARDRPSYPHPGLLNAIYLWALGLSKEPSFQIHADVYLHRAINALQKVVGDGLGDPNDAALPTRVLHVMQAEVLVAQYFFAHGRILEGRYHANAAVSLAVGVSSTLGLLTQTLPPVKTCVEYGERVNIFWSVYNVDRCWSVIGNPCIMSDDAAHGTQIDTSWPLDIHQYEMMDMKTDALRHTPCDRTIQRFLSGEPPPNGVNDSSFAALRVKASAIHERVTKLAATCKASQPGSPARESVERDMKAFSVFLSDFIASIAPFPEVENLEERITSSDDRRTVYVVHSLIHTSKIILHGAWAEEDGNQVESDICLEEAYEIARVPRAGVELGLLDPVLGTTGMILASLFVREVTRARKAPQTPESMKRLRRMEAGMQFLKETAIWGKDRPVYGIQVPKILAILAKAEKP